MTTTAMMVMDADDHGAGCGDDGNEATAADDMKI